MPSVRLAEILRGKRLTRRGIRAFPRLLLSLAHFIFCCACIIFRCVTIVRCFQCTKVLGMNLFTQVLYQRNREVG